jgi:hypothetical protein
VTKGNCPNIDAFAGLKTTATSCEALSGSNLNSGFKTTVLQTSGEAVSLDNSIRLTYSAPSGGKSLTVDVVCDHSASGFPVPTYSANVSTAGNPHITMKSKYGCPVTSINAIWTFLSQYSYLFGAIMIAAGVLIAFAGRKMFKPVICFIGTIATAGVVMMLLYSLFLGNTNGKSAVGWIVLVLSLVGGCIVGLLLAKLTKLGAMVLAGWGGVTLGLMLYGAFLYHINSQVFFWFFIVACAGICALASLWAYDHVLIISTAISGSYMFVRGISMYAGGYPNEATLETLIKNGLESAIPNTFYAYLAGIVVMMILAMIVQYKTLKAEKDESRHPYHNLRH